MIYVSKEGSELKNGLHFYPWKDRHTSGIAVKLKLGNRLWAIRYSIKARKVFLWNIKA